MRQKQQQRSERRAHHRKWQLNMKNDSYFLQEKWGKQREKAALWEQERNERSEKKK